MNQKRVVVLAALSTASVLLFAGSASAFEAADNARWSSTFSSGGGLTQGTPTILRWSIVPDGNNLPSGNVSGESTDTSSLITRLDALFGVVGATGTNYSARPWFFIFESSFNRWANVSGLSYQYVTDDGATMSGGAPGSATRGDVRIGGHSLDGASNVLAYNFFPNSGDMVLDTTDFVPGNFNSSTNNYRFIRNVVMHEHGHGIGISHVAPVTGSKLMEPFVNTSFDGPQFDDVLAAQRLYGDALEKSGGNDTVATGSVLGNLTRGLTISRGTSTSNSAATRLTASDTDLISIDDESDRDFFKFTVASAMSITLNLAPRGATYLEGPQNSSGVSFNASAQADLRLQLFGTDGTSLLLQNLTGVGGSEAITNFILPAGGTYFFSVFTTTVNLIQMYRFDLTANGIPGDYNADGYVDAADYTVWADAFGATGTGLPADGNRDGVVDAADYTVWADNFGQGTPPGGLLSSSVPEPMNAGVGLAAAGLVLTRARRR